MEGLQHIFIINAVPKRREARSHALNDSLINVEAARGSKGHKEETAGFFRKTVLNPESAGNSGSDHLHPRLLHLQGLRVSQGDLRDSLGVAGLGADRLPVPAGTDGPNQVGRYSWEYLAMERLRPHMHPRNKFFNEADQKDKLETITKQFFDLFYHTGTAIFIFVFFRN